MKKRLLFVAILVFVINYTNAQLINPGFETWSNDMLVPSAMNPNTGNATYGWWDYNFFNSNLLGSSPISVTQCTDTVHGGNYSVRLETKVYTSTSWNFYKNWGYPFIGHEYNDTLGILFNGNVDVATPEYIQGIPCTDKLTQFKFYYQYNPNGNDTAECRVSLVSNGDYVAGGVFKTSVATGNSGWQQAVIDFTYINQLQPDTLYVLFSSSSLDDAPKAGSVLWIDDASIIFPNGIEQVLEEENSITIFPNPFSDHTVIKFENTKGNAYRLDIFDETGRQVRSISNITGSRIILNRDKFNNNGIYFVQLRNSEGVVYTRKIITY